MSTRPNKIFRILTLLVIVTLVIIGYATFPTKTEPPIPDVKEKSKLKDVTTESVYAQLANQNLKGLKAKTVNEVLELSDDEIDLATAILLISKKTFDDLYHIDVDIAKYRHRIDDMAVALSKKIGTEREPEDIIQALNHYFFKDLNFSHISAKKNPKAIFLNFVLDENKANCLGLSILYLSLAERIGLPLYGVSPPYHFFVRYEEDGKSINIEITDKGKFTSDDFYKERFNISEGSAFYLKSLGKQETVSTFLGNVGNLYLEKGRPDEAISLYKKALVIIPRYVEVHSRLGTAYADKGMFAEAISEQKKALAIDPESDIAHGNLGEIYFRMNKLDEAVLACKKAIAINPENAQAHNSLGNCYMAKDLLDQSISEFKTALTIEPNNAILHSNLGLAYSHKGMLDEAISEYKKTLAINPNYAPAHYNLAVVYYYKKRYVLAIKHCDRATQLGYRVKPALLNLLKPYR